MTTQTIPPPPDNSGLAQAPTIPPPPDGSGTVGHEDKKGFSPYDNVAITPPPPKPTTFWNELGRQLYSEPDPNNPTLAYKLIHPLVEGVKQGAKDIGEAVPEFLDSPLHSTLKTIKGAGEIAFNIIPQAVLFSTATNAIKMAADQTPYGKEVGEALDLPFTLATKVANLAGYNPEADSNGELALGILDIIAGGKIAHETISTTKGGKLKDAKGELVKDKEGNPVPIEVPTIAGKAIKTFADLTGITEKVAKGELTPEQVKEFDNYLEGLKKITPNDVIKGVEKLGVEGEKLEIKNPEEQTDKQKSDMLYDYIKSNNVETLKTKLQEAADNGSLTKAQLDEGLIRLNSYQKYLGKIKDKGFDDLKQKEVTHAAWKTENSEYTVNILEKELNAEREASKKDPTRTVDPFKEAELSKHREDHIKNKDELRQLLYDEPAEIDKEAIKESKKDPVLDSEEEFIQKLIKTGKWKDLRDDLESKLKRAPTPEEAFAEARRIYREKNPIQAPKEVSQADKKFEEAMSALTEEQKMELEADGEKKSEPKVEKPKAEVKVEAPKVEVKAEPKSEEKTFKSKHEELIAKKNKTKTKENPAGDVVTEEAIFRIGDDFGYVEFADGTKANVATNPKAGTTIGFGNGKKLPKDGSKVTVEAKAADAERPFDRVNIHGFDKDGKPVRGMLRATNKSSNILEKTGEKNNPGAYADQAISGLTEADRQAIIEKEAADAGLKKEEAKPKEGDKPVIDLDKKPEKQKRPDNPYSDAKIDANFVPLEKRSKEAQSFIKKMLGEGEKSEQALLSLGLDVSKSDIKGVLKDFKEGKNTNRLSRVMDKLSTYAENDNINITEGSGIAVGGRGTTIKEFLKKSFGDENKTKQEGNADPLQDISRGMTEKEQQEILEKEARDAEGNKPQKQKEAVKPSKELINKVVDRLQKALPKLKVVYDKTIEGAGQLDADGKTVRVNPFKAGTDTPIHEYGHALIDIYGGLANKLVKGAIERLKTTPLWAEVTGRYPELSNDMLAKEVLAEAIGREGKKIFEKEAQQTWFKNFTDNFFYKIKKLLGLERDNVKILTKQLLGGKELSKEVVANREVQLQKMSEDELFKQFAEVYHPKSKMEKFKDRVTDVLNIPRALITSMDMSAPMRQGVVYTLSKPKVAAASAKQMFRQAFSEKNSINWLLDLRNKREYEIMKDSDLFIADPHASRLTNKEEHFMTNLAQKIPVIGSMIKGSERAYAAYLNKMRTDIFVNQIHAFEKAGLKFEQNKELYKAAANVINHFTGRGHLGKLETSAQVLNTAFFSPRLIASRFQMLNPVWYAKQPKLVQIQAIKDFGTFIGVGSTILALAAAGGAKVETDPRNSDFGKIQIGKTRLDVWGGFQQWVRTYAQVLSGTKITASGKKIDLDKGRASRLDVIGSFARGKVAPIPALAMEILQGRKVTGEKLKASEVLLDNTIPLYMQDMMEAAKQEGGASILSVGIPAFFGVGTQTYNTNKK